jgi:hypothetical protein
MDDGGLWSAIHDDEVPKFNRSFVELSPSTEIKKEKKNSKKRKKYKAYLGVCLWLSPLCLVA